MNRSPEHWGGHRLWSKAGLAIALGTVAYAGMRLLGGVKSGSEPQALSGEWKPLQLPADHENPEHS